MKTMNSPQWVQILKSLLGESGRHAMASWLFPLLLVYSTLILTIALTVRFTNIPSTGDFEIPQRVPIEEANRLGREGIEQSGIPLIQGEIKLLFGSIRIPWNKFRENAIRYLESFLLFFTSDAVGILFAIVWTSGFMPEFLQGFWWNMFRIRPISLGMLIFLKSISVAFVFFLHGIILILGTWFALGLSTGGWNTLFLWSLLVLVVQFFTFYPVSVYLGALTRNTLIAIVGTMGFWVVCWAVNQARVDFYSTDTLEATSQVAAGMVDIAYWILPKPIDFSLILSDLTGTMKEYPPPTSWLNAWEKGHVLPFFSILTSLASGAVAFWFACLEIKNPTRE